MSRRKVPGLPLSVYTARRRSPEDRGVADDATTADFADYATLRRGIGFERGRIAWLRWLMRRLDADGSSDDEG